MNILIHMGDQFTNENPAPKRMRVFYDTLEAKGHCVTVIAPRKEKTTLGKYKVVSYPTIRMKKKTTLMRMLNQLSIVFNSVMYARKCGQIDVVLTTSPPALIGPSGWLIAKMKRAKLVYDVRDIWPDVAWEMGSFTEKSMYSRVFTVVRNFMLKHADLVTTVSPGKVEKLKAYAPETSVVYITNGLDENFLKNKYCPAVTERYSMEHRFNCVYIGNLGWAQGLKQLLMLAQKAKENLSAAQFLLFGSGVEEDLLREYVRQNDLTNVVFAGKIFNEDVYSVLKASQISFVSLVNENLKDSVPTKMFEAIGVGCPVLLSAVGDAADILNQSRLGRAVCPNEKDALWEAFIEMHDNYDAILEQREFAVQYILEHYSRQKAALQLEKVLCELVTNKNEESVKTK